ncbi:MAG: hypothetical protein KGH75_02735 [Rhodospirillales bacterium]|nr:hypothetical protein [Rhodospirillales bacterium]
MATKIAGSITTANTSQVLFAKSPYSNSLHGYQVQNTSSGILYVEDGGTAATTTSMQIPAGQTYTSPEGCHPTLGVTILGATAGQTFVAKIY